MNKNKKSTKKNKKPAAPRAPKAPRIVKHGQVQPKVGGKTRAIWDICDALAAKHKRTPARSEVFAAAPRGSNVGMVATQYGYWRKFAGIKGRVSVPGAAKPAKACKAKPAKARKTVTPKAPKAPKLPAAPKVPAAPKAPKAPPAAPAAPVVAPAV